MNKAKLKIPHRRHTDEFYEVADQIEEVLAPHFPDVIRRQLQHRTYSFMDDYRDFEADFWSREGQIPVIETIQRQLVSISRSFDSLPQVIMNELEAMADEHGENAKEAFLRTTTRDFLFKSELPGPDAATALKALRALSDHHEKLAEVFEKLRRSLPSGMPTRNRPGDAYAVIYASICMCREDGAINVPKAVKETGPFFRLLSDLFQLFGITTSVEGAYKGWVKNVEDKYDNFDLMQI
jgi:hypothetical protein